MLRYNGDSQYRTFTGGILSMTVVFVVIAGFFNMICETINRTAIESNLNVVTSSSPSAFNLTTSPANMFMFAVQIQSQDVQFNYDIGGDRRYFDLAIKEYVTKYGFIQR